MAATVAILKIFNSHLLPNDNSDWAQTSCEAFWWHGDLELLNSLHSNIQEGRNGGQLENLEMTYAPEL